MRTAYPPCLILCCILALALPASAATINVPLGSSIQTAIDGANAGDVIQLAKGTYTQRIDFKGKAIKVRGTKTFAILETTLNGSSTTKPTVTFTSGETRTAILENVIVTGGAPGIMVTPPAGTTDPSSPTLRGCRIIENNNSTNGGGLYAYRSGLLIDRCSFRDNHTNLNGGGAFLDLAKGINITKCIFNDNTSTFKGGGLMISNPSDLVMSECTIYNNTAGSDGGGVCLASGLYQMTDCTVFANTTSANGGGIWAETGWGASRLSDNEVFDNKAGENGGGICLERYVTITDRNLVYGNEATGEGGGALVDGNALLSGWILARNKAASGGGLAIHGDLAKLRNSIVAFNKPGGGIDGTGTPASAFTYNCIFGNTAANLTGITGVIGSNGNISGDPRFANMASGDFRLKSCNGRWDYLTNTWAYDNVTSPCISTGDPALAYANEPAPNGSRINMGVHGNTFEASKDSIIFSRRPGLLATDIPPMQPVFLRFRKQVVEGSVEQRFTITPEGGAALTGSFNWTKPFLEVEWRPTKPLPKATKMTVTLSKGIRARDGQVYDWSESWNFNTGNQPGILSYSPQGDTVPVGRKIKILFDTPMHRVSCQNNFVIKPAVAGTFAWSASQLIFSPNAPLAAGTTYTVTETRKARSSTGVEMGWPFVWSFTTEIGTSALAMTASAATSNSGVTAITVHLSSTATVQASILNLAGREVAVLPSRECAGGVTTLLWDGRSRNGTATPAGRYLVRLCATSGDGAATSCLTPLQR